MPPLVRGEPAEEIANEQLMLEVCPACERNDGAVLVGDRYWVVCHGHQVRWPISSGFFNDPDARGRLTTRGDASTLDYREIRGVCPYSLRPGIFVACRNGVDARLVAQPPLPADEALVTAATTGVFAGGQ